MSDAEKIDIHTLFEQAKKDPSLFSTLDIQKLIDSVDNVKHDYLENRTLESINKEIYDAIADIDKDRVNLETLCEKLIGYRYVDKINEIHKGKHIRWIRVFDSKTQKPLPQNNIKLMAGGMVTNIKFLDNGTHIQCMGPGNRFIQYKFDECISFQKLTVEEQMLLMAQGNLPRSL
jgi:hypothetical protein